jgi:antitoxin component YwqK of YwqJK toxin-antitoxin module
MYLYPSFIIFAPMKTKLAIIALVFSVMSCGTDASNAANETASSDSVKTTTQDSGENEIKLEVSNSIPKENLPDGEFKSTYPNGDLKVTGLVEASQRVGLWTSYFPGGNKQSENNYALGYLNGKSVVYYPSGQIMYIGYYNNGKPDGQWLYFDETGKMTKNISYKNGEAIEHPVDNP